MYPLICICLKSYSITMSRLKMSNNICRQLIRQFKHIIASAVVAMLLPMLANSYIANLKYREKSEN